MSLVAECDVGGGEQAKVAKDGEDDELNGAMTRRCVVEQRVVGQEFARRE